jgi:thiol-disulfide isomerase/thioredoxin
LNAPVAASLFTFTPPAGARQVDQFTQYQEDPDLSGQIATDFTLPDLAGHLHRLSDHRGSIVMLDFWATWCGPCRVQMPAVDRLYQEYRSQGLVVYAVNQGESAERARAYFERHQYTTTALLDPRGEVGQEYQVRGMPTLVIVDRQGKIVAHYLGLRSEDTLREGLKKAGIK